MWPAAPKCTSCMWIYEFITVWNLNAEWFAINFLAYFRRTVLNQPPDLSNGIGKWSKFTIFPSNCNEIHSVLILLDFHRSSKLALGIMLIWSMDYRISDHFTRCQELWKMLLLSCTLSIRYNVSIIDSCRHTRRCFKRYSLLLNTTMAWAHKSQGKYFWQKHTFYHDRWCLFIFPCPSRYYLLPILACCNCNKKESKLIWLKRILGFLKNGMGKLQIWEIIFRFGVTPFSKFFTHWVWAFVLLLSSHPTIDLTMIFIGEYHP